MTRWLCRRRVRAIVTTWAVVCAVLLSCGRSAANVTIFGLQPAAELEPVDDQFRGLAADFGLAAVAVSRYGSFDWPQRSRHLGDIMPSDAPAWADAPKADAACSPWQMARPLGEAPGNLALTTDDYSELLLPPNTFASAHAANIASIDSTYLPDVTALGDVVLEPALPFGAVVLAGLGAGMIGWSWRRRVLSRGKYP